MAKSVDGPLPTQIDDLVVWLKQAAASARKFPEDPASFEPQSVILEKAFVDFLNIDGSPLAGTLQEGENVVAPGYAEILKVAQTCTSLFEREATHRLHFYFVIGLAYRLGYPFFSRFRFEKFGNQPLDLDKASELLAGAFEFSAKFLRGKWMPPKGRVDVELVRVVNFIQQHCIRRMSQSELREAVVHAGIQVPDEETWKVWLHRARKKKLVDPPTIFPKEIEFFLKSDGSIDLSRLDPVARRILIHSIRSGQFSTSLQSSGPSGPGSERHEELR